MIVQDIILEDNDLLIEDGDFVVRDATKQNQALLLMSQKGEWKQNPTVGVGIGDWLKGEKQGGLKAEIKKQFGDDGMKILKVLIENNTISIDANY